MEDKLKSAFQTLDNELDTFIETRNNIRIQNISRQEIRKRNIRRIQKIRKYAFKKLDDDLDIIAQLRNNE